MKLEDFPFTVTDWSTVESVVYPGERGSATWRTVQAGDIRIRMVDYSPGYVADHWCERGHIILVVEGELDTEIRGEGTHHMSAGMTYPVASGLSPHRSVTHTGARLFIVD